MNTTKAPLHITRLEIESFKRVRVARITPNGAIVQIAGKNKQGKTSILDAIEALLVGKKATPALPIHDGKRFAKTKAWLGTTEDPKQWIISRKYENGKDGPTQSLEVIGPDGQPVTKKVETTISDLFAGLSFEVSRFLDLDAAKQDALLKEVAGIDFTELDAQYKAADEERTIKGRELKAIKARIEAKERIFDAPKKEETSADILAELDAATERANQIRDLGAEITDIEAGAEREHARIEQLEHELAALRESVALRDQKKLLKKQLLETMQPIDPAPIKARLAALEENNRKVRSNAELDEMEAEQSAIEDKLGELLDRLEVVKTLKAEHLAAAKFPVAGLGFDESGITLNGFPLNQASKRQKLELCVAVACELNPQLLVFLVRDAAVFDEAGLAELAEFAEKRGAQVWLEMVKESPTAGVVFVEDGEVVDPPVA
jgi:hypothetical protein